MPDRINDGFVVDGVRCAAALTLPDGAREGAPPPVVVMAHGFGADRSLGLQPFIDAFAAAGLAVYAFDYRCFGESEGAPRNLIDPRRHLADWRAAVARARALPQVDASRLALWGTSFSGGHALVTAAGDAGVAGVVAQVPFVDGLATARTFSLGNVARGLVHGLRDAARALLDRPPHEVPILGRAGAYALLNTPDAWPGFLAMGGDPATYRNAAPARIALRVPLYRPVRACARVRCPVLVVAARRDTLIPLAAVRRAARRLPRAELHELDLGHFDVYAGAGFAAAAALEVAFLRRVLHAGARNTQL